MVISHFPLVFSRFIRLSPAFIYATEPQSILSLVAFTHWNITIRNARMISHARCQSRNVVADAVHTRQGAALTRHTPDPRSVTNALSDRILSAPIVRKLNSGTLQLSDAA